MGEGQQEIKEGDGPRLCRAVSNDFRRPVKGTDQQRDGKVQEDSDQLCRHNGTEDAETGSFFCTAVLLCPKVLADESSQRKGKAGNGKEAEAFDF